MKSIDYIIQDKEGIHARPAGQLVQEAKKFSCAVTVENKGKKVDAKRLLAVMSLAAKCGENIIVSCDGPDEEAAIAALGQFLTANL